MRNIGCDEVRELLPELDADRLALESAAMLRSHIASCESCRAVASLIARLRTSAPLPPDGLQAKVMRSLGRLEAVEAGTPAEDSGGARARLHLVNDKRDPDRRAPRSAIRGGRLWLRMAGVRRWALAASVTIMVAAGAVIWRSSTGDDSSLTTLDAGADSGQSAASPLLEWPAGNGVVAGGAVLDGLSDDQLQALLEEMQS